MEREIKYRAWDGEQMRQVWSLHFPDNNVHVAAYDEDGHEKLKGEYLKNVPVMQYTGLHDKNGMEVFEGDIIDVTNDWYCNAVVVFDNGSFKLELDGKYGQKYDTLYSFADDSEIIGNIHQDPELLKGGEV